MSSILGVISDEQFKAQENGPEQALAAFRKKGQEPAMAIFASASGAVDVWLTPLLQTDEHFAWARNALASLAAIDMRSRFRPNGSETSSAAAEVPINVISGEPEKTN